jgi:hypothetical protein
MFKDGQLICDSCQAVISRVTETPADGWPKLHCLCSACFAAAWQKQG